MSAIKSLLVRMLNNSLITILAISLLVACGQNGSEESITLIEENQQKSQSKASLDQKKVPQELLTLAGGHINQEMPAEKDSIPEENLYGKFFDERAEFYIIQEPKNSLYRSKVKKLTLYYLDGQLSQTRYILEEDIINDLLQLYGSFGIVGHDAKNQALIQSKQVIVNTSQGRVLNKALDNYQITWQLEQQLIRYRVNKNEPKNRFNYLERIKTYKKTFSEIEQAGA
ncbi:hypothetical protein GXP67_16500 [Rhodocytophaga rosea]|uniref:Uncharacterized protein n=1 Tax=Rhodocytophaga rosea TaxID=2704465 RepID=A0A6C0GJG6_9BACT|nr:hypothetical protein [Rhodocytophaga rosea]QHT68125.1 hypothetical protein GXP67_16500 [Rhodocytophaga rosea]